MTGPVERVPLTDEQLAEWERWASGGVGGWLDDFASRVVLALIAELRASRAREQELRTEVDAAREHEMQVAERCGELQQRIDRALAMCEEQEALSRIEKVRQEIWRTECRGCQDNLWDEIRRIREEAGLPAEGAWL